jgi:hypothetical protein
MRAWWIGMHAWLAPHEREEGPVSPAVTPAVDIQLAVRQVRCIPVRKSALERVDEFVKFIDTV